MNNLSKTRATLQTHFTANKARIDCLARMIHALVKTRSVNLNQLRIALKGSVQPESNEKRLHRFLDTNVIKPADLILFVLLLLPPWQRQKLFISLDRTEWDTNGVTNNLLTMAIVIGKLSVPILGFDLGKSGSSKNADRIKIVKHMLKFIPVKHIQGFMADREFASCEFLKFLNQKKLKFYLRLKCDALITHEEKTQQAGEWFKSSRERKLEHCTVYGQVLSLVGKTIKDGRDVLIIATNASVADALKIYRLRWRIETMFSALKTRGFNFEETRVTLKARIERLLQVLAVTLVWCLRVGALAIRKRATRVMPNGRVMHSIFRRGLDVLRELLFEGGSRVLQWFEVFYEFDGDECFMVCVT